MSWPDRAILGRHQSHTNETVAVYSRDLAVGPVTRFSGMLSEICKGSFCPDAERSRYVPFPPVPPEVPVDAVAEQAIAQDCELAVECKVEPLLLMEFDRVVIAVQTVRAVVQKLTLRPVRTMSRQLKRPKLPEGCQDQSEGLGCRAERPAFRIFARLILQEGERLLVVELGPMIL